MNVVHWFQLKALEHGVREVVHATPNPTKTSESLKDGIGTVVHAENASEFKDKPVAGASASAEEKSGSADGPPAEEANWFGADGVTVREAMLMSSVAAHLAGGLDEEDDVTPVSVHSKVYVTLQTQSRGSMFPVEVLPKTVIVNVIPHTPIRRVIEDLDASLQPMVDRILGIHGSTSNPSVRVLGLGPLQEDARPLDTFFLDSCTSFPTRLTAAILVLAKNKH